MEDTDMCREKGYLIVTDYIPANTGKDVSDALQELILANPNRTIYFPDGEYVLAKPVDTPANPVHSVSLELSAYAVIKASDDWSSTEAMIRLGAAEPFNDINTPGSNYYLTGGIIDGNGKANGISIDSGRETCIHHTSIKRTRIGIYIKWGANSRSSDADIHNVNIVGNGKVGSIGVLIEGCDNTLTNMRIANVQIGIKNYAPSQFLRNIHPLYTYGEYLKGHYEDSCAFWDDAMMESWYNNCYSDQFATGFRIKGGARHTYSDCFCFWYKAEDVVQRGFAVDGKFDSIIKGCRVHFNWNSHDNNVYISVAEKGGNGIIAYPITERVTDKTHEEYLVGKII